MKKKRVGLLREKKVPLLSDGREPRSEQSQSFRSVSARGRISAVIAFLLCGAVIFLACGGGMITGISDGTANRLAGWMAGLSFMDLSGVSGTEKKEGDGALSELLEGILLPDHSTDTDVGKEEDSMLSSDSSASSEKPSPPLSLQALYSFDYNAVPKGEVPIVPMDLSLSDLGHTYINNSTGLKPDVEALLTREFESSSTLVSLANKREPKVLILHTHGTEAYSEDGAISYADDGSEIARSEDVRKNVVSVGKVLADALTQAGISTLHCEIMHDQAQYKDSYTRAEQTVRRYLEEYPSIRLVIDVHRDSILKSDGSLVRPVTLTDGKATAQVMCVVGSDWGGGDYPDWERNLSLALKLRKSLNEESERICRPVYLKSSTYNQELAPYSLLLEIGAGGNSLVEAQRAAVKVAQALCEIIPEL